MQVNCKGKAMLPGLELQEQVVAMVSWVWPGQG